VKDLGSGSGLVRFVLDNIPQKGVKNLLCQFEKMIYPPNPAQADPGSYMIALYRPCEKIKDASGQVLTQVKAVGYCLPVADHMRYEMQGHWSRHQNHGLQFEVESYD